MKYSGLMQDWLAYLGSFPSGLARGSLEPVKNVAFRLGLLNLSSKIITIAGTNGKGSTAVFLESILLAAGFTTGVYISPHLVQYNERIRLNGKNIDDHGLIQAFKVVEEARQNTSLSYFEFSTLAALTIFKNHKPDVLILEVGLGGRLDAVNILDSDIAIITTISFDHTHVLGRTLEAIGHEKSGIMRPFKAVICGKNMPRSVYENARELKAKPYFLGRDFDFLAGKESWVWNFGSQIIKDLPMPKLPISNAALAIMAVQLLSSDDRVSFAAIASGIKKAFLHGRFERRIFLGKEVIFDVAHNPESAALLANNLAQEKNSGRVLGVFSMLNDKDIGATIKPLVGVVDRWYVGVLSDLRAASGEWLRIEINQAGVCDFAIFDSVITSFKQAIAECQEKDKIAVFGSFHTVAEVLANIR